MSGLHDDADGQSGQETPASAGSGHNAEAMLRETRAAHARGWALTPAKKKSPFRSGWQKEEPLSLDVLEPLTRRCNIALRCGSASGVLVLDDDSDEQNAGDLLSLPPTVTVITGRGRRHYYFRMPEQPVPNKSSAFGLKVEVRGNGTAVLLPGSTHPDTGQLYRWLQGHDPDSIALAEFPDLLLAALLRPVARPQASPSRSNSNAPRGNLVERSAERIRSAPEGERNNTLNKEAYFLGGIVGRGDLERSAVEEALLPAAIESGLPERASRASLASGLGKGIANPLPPPTRPGSPIGPPSPPKPKEKSRPEPQRPFPLHLLPEDVQGYCKAIADARSVDVSMVGALVIASLGSAIGMSRCAWDSFSDWTEYPAIWVAVVMRSGGRKSPVLEDVFAVHHKRQAELYDVYRAAMETYERELDAWERAQKKGSKASKDDVPASKPQEPKLGHIYTTDATQEAMVMLLADTPRGLVVINDELAGFFGSMGRYGNGRTDADRAFWLSMFRGTSAKIDRATKGTIYVKKGLASVVGGVQPTILARCFDEATFGSGLASRFLLVMPNLPVKQYLGGPTKEQRASYQGLLERLLALPFGEGFDPRGDVTQETIKVPFTEGCRDFLRKWIPIWSAEGLESAESVEAAMSKLEAFALRIALILKTCREANGKAQSDDPIQVKDLEAAAELARWFRDEAVRVYRALGQEVEPGVERVLAARVERIRFLGGAVTVREWRQRNTRRSQDEAKAELDELVAAELATWCERQPGKKGGARTTECRIIGPSVAAELATPGDEGDEVGEGADEDAGEESRGPDGSGELAADAVAGEVPLCSPSADQPVEGRSAGPDRTSHSGEVPGCVVRCADTPADRTHVLGPGKGTEPRDELQEGGRLHNGTSPGPEVNSVEAESRIANPECTTHNATRNLFDALGTAEQPSADGLVEDLRAVLPGSQEVAPGAKVVPIETAFGMGPLALTVCRACGGGRWWRRRDTGHGEPGDWICHGCCPSILAEQLIERVEAVDDELPWHVAISEGDRWGTVEEGAA